MGTIYAQVGKPSPAKFRRRLEVIRDASHSGELMAMRWNPKGRDFEARREMVQFFQQCHDFTTAMLQHFERGLRKRR